MACDQRFAVILICIWPVCMAFDQRFSVIMLRRNTDRRPYTWEHFSHEVLLHLQLPACCRELHVESFLCIPVWLATQEFLQTFTKREVCFKKHEQWLLIPPRYPSISTILNTSIYIVSYGSTTKYIDKNRNNIHLLSLWRSDFFKFKELDFVLGKLLYECRIPNPFIRFCY